MKRPSRCWLTSLICFPFQQWASKLRIPTDDELVPQATLDKIKMFISNHAREIKVRHRPGSA